MLDVRVSCSPRIVFQRHQTVKPVQESPFLLRRASDGGHVEFGIPDCPVAA